MSVTVDSQILSFAKGMQMGTAKEIAPPGMDTNVVLAHWMSEEPIDSLAKWTKVGNNPAGIKHGNSAVDQYAIKVDDRGFDVFPTPLAGYLGYHALIMTDSHYQGIRDAIKTGDPQKELQAIADSPWDAGHYGGDGHKLFDAYNAITDSSLKVKNQDAAAAVIDPSTPEGQQMQKDMDQFRADNRANAIPWLTDKLGIKATPWELGVVILGSVGILILLIMLVKDEVGVPV